MNKPESVLENETHEIFWVFKIQMDHPILSDDDIERKQNIVKRETYT